MLENYNLPLNFTRSTILYLSLFYVHSLTRYARSLAQDDKSLKESIDDERFELNVSSHHHYLYGRGDKKIGIYAPIYLSKECFVSGGAGTDLISCYQSDGTVKGRFAIEALAEVKTRDRIYTLEKFDEHTFAAASSGRVVIKKVVK